MPFDPTIFDNKYIFGALSAVAGAVLTLVMQQVSNKRAFFTYFSSHSRVGVSSNDPIFGSIQVTWNNNPVANLYSSTVELTNQSLKDFENVVVRLYTSDTQLLTERTEIVGTPNIVYWTPEFANSVFVAPGQQATQAQIDIVRSSRRYLVPIMNRGQVIRFQFLNVPKGDHPPSIWLDVMHKGVRVRFQVPQPKMLGVSTPSAALMGIALGLVLWIFLVSYVNTVWVAALCALIYGFGAQVPGALVIRGWRSLREWFGG